jgi:hypothetical protein
VNYEDADLMLKMISKMREDLGDYGRLSQEQREVDSCLMRVALFIRKQILKAA